MVVVLEPDGAILMSVAALALVSPFVDSVVPTAPYWSAAGGGRADALGADVDVLHVREGPAVEPGGQPAPAHVDGRLVAHAASS